MAEKKSGLRDLTALEVAKLKKPGLHRVGGVRGLGLQIGDSPNVRSWVLRVKHGSIRRYIGCGSYPVVTLAMARERAMEKRRMIESGIDPVAHRKQERVRLLKEQKAAMTFDRACEECIKGLTPTWTNPKSASQWTNTLKTYASPVMGRLLVQDVTKEHVLQVLKPIWSSKSVTAKLLRGRIATVLSWAYVECEIDKLNPARSDGYMDILLPSKTAPKNHHKALAVSEVGAFMVELRKLSSTSARCLEFAILCASRSGEVRNARWSDIDFDARLFSIPAERMKMKKPHRVPLSEVAIQVLREQEKHSSNDPDGLIFTAPRGGALSDMSLLQVMRRMSVPAVPHGFRSTYRVWVSERTNYPGDMAEVALAHEIGDKVMQAYNRTEYLEKRRAMMRDWAEFLSKIEPKGGNVVPITTTKAAKPARKAVAA